MKIIVVILLLSQPVIASEWKSISGAYAVTSVSAIDPPDHLPADSHYRFQLTGSSAKDLYIAMKVEPKIDECTGGIAKNIKDMQCIFFKESATYECHFSINISEQEIEYGVPC